MIKDLKELLQEGIIDEITANKILTYYETKKSQSPNKLLLLFGVLGSTLAGLGLVLIVAHNWDTFSTTLKLFFACLPMMIAQSACLYSYFKKPSSDSWRESASVFLFLAIGASLTLVSQIYHLPGNEKELLFIWIICTMPIMYVMNSRVSSILSILFITYYGILDYDSSGLNISTYWLFLALVLPYYFYLTRKHSKNMTTLFHHWLIPASITIMLASLTRTSSPSVLLAYCLLLGVFYQIGQTKFFSNLSVFQNGYRFVGFAGILLLLIVFTFENYWKTIQESGSLFENDLSLSLWLSLGFLISCLVLAYVNGVKKSFEPVFISVLIYAIFFMLALPSYVPALFFNFYTLFVGIFFARTGIINHRMGIMNLGISIISILIISRFFDTNIPFILKGILFLGVGILVFIMNYYMASKQKKDAA